MRASQRKIKQELFIAAFGKCGSIKQACTIAGIDRKTFYNWKKDDKQFAEQFTEAEEDACDTIDDEIVRRSIEGIEEPLVSMGRIVCEEVPMLDKEGKEVLDKQGNPKMRRGSQITVRKYSDTLLLALAKSRMPKYRDKQNVELTGKNGGRIEVDENMVITTIWGRGTA